MGFNSGPEGAGEGNPEVRGAAMESGQGSGDITRRCLKVEARYEGLRQGVNDCEFRDHCKVSAQAGVAAEVWSNEGDCLVDNLGVTVSLAATITPIPEDQA